MEVDLLEPWTRANYQWLRHRGMTPYIQKPLLPLAPLLSEASEPSSRHDGCSADGLSLKHIASAAVRSWMDAHIISKASFSQDSSHLVCLNVLSFYIHFCDVSEPMDSLVLSAEKQFILSTLSCHKSLHYRIACSKQKLLWLRQRATLWIEIEIFKGSFISCPHRKHQ